MLISLSFPTHWIKEAAEDYTPGMHDFIPNANTYFKCHINIVDHIHSMPEAYVKYHHLLFLNACVIHNGLLTSSSSSCFQAETLVCDIHHNPQRIMVKENRKIPSLQRRLPLALRTYNFQLKAYKRADRRLRLGTATKYVWLMRCLRHSCSFTNKYQ